MAVPDWLLDSDPAIRWQVLHDLVGAPADVVATERARVATEGWGARLRALQGEDGQWERGALFPSGRGYFAENHERDEGQPWTATAYSLARVCEGASGDKCGNGIRRLTSPSIA